MEGQPEAVARGAFRMTSFVFGRGVASGAQADVQGEGPAAPYVDRASVGDESVLSDFDAMRAL